ncbi:hypothetical protein AALC25_19825 [Lachnospiraceae bacterium 29-84]
MLFVAGIMFRRKIQEIKVRVYRKEKRYGVVLFQGFCGSVILKMEVLLMLTLQEQVVQKVSGLSEDNLQFLLEMINRFMEPDLMEKETAGQRIGIAKGQDLYDDDYDFDEMNPEIAALFGGME